jgi:hypothetical protein
MLIVHRCHRMLNVLLRSNKQRMSATGSLVKQPDSDDDEKSRKNKKDSGDFGPFKGPATATAMDFLRAMQRRVWPQTPLSLPAGLQSILLKPSIAAASEATQRVRKTVLWLRSDDDSDRDGDNDKVATTDVIANTLESHAESHTLPLGMNSSGASVASGVTDCSDVSAPSAVKNNAISMARRGSASSNIDAGTINSNAKTKGRRRSSTNAKSITAHVILFGGLAMQQDVLRAVCSYL